MNERNVGDEINDFICLAKVIVKMRFRTTRWYECWFRCS